MSPRVPLFNMTLGAFIARAALVLIVVIWTVPTFGLFISSFRDKDQLAVSGWWTALGTTVKNGNSRTGTEAVQEGDRYVISGTTFEGSSETVNAWGLRAVAPN